MGEAIRRKRTDDGELGRAGIGLLRPKPTVALPEPGHPDVVAPGSEAARSLPHCLWGFLASKPDMNLVKALGPTSTHRIDEGQHHQVNVVHQVNDATRASRMGNGVQTVDLVFATSHRLEKDGTLAEVDGSRPRRVLLTLVCTLLGTLHVEGHSWDNRGHGTENGSSSLRNYGTWLV